MQDIATEGSAQRQIPPIAIIGVFPPPVGGQAVYNQSLVNELIRRGWDAVGIDCSSTTSSTGPVVSAPSRKDLVRVLNNGAFSLYHLTASDIRLFGFEIVLAVLSLLHRLPLIVTLLTGQFGQRTSQYSRTRRYLLGLALRRASRILVSNANQERALRQLPLLSHARIDTIGCSMPLTESLEYDPTLTAFLKQGAPAIVAVGAMRKVYGFPLLIEACTLLRDMGLSPRLLIAVSGKDDEEIAASVAESVQTADGSVDVRVERELSHGVCLGCIESADILARPTTTDGDSVSVHEALQLGTAVVASNATPRPAGVILHDSGDAHTLAASLAQAYRARSDAVGRSAEQATSIEDIIRCYRAVLSIQ